MLSAHKTLTFTLVRSVPIFLHETFNPRRCRGKSEPHIITRVKP